MDGHSVRTHGLHSARQIRIFFFILQFPARPAYKLHRELCHLYSSRKDSPAKIIQKHQFCNMSTSVSIVVTEKMNELATIEHSQVF